MEGMSSVLEKLFSYLRCQKKALMKKNIISAEMDEAFQELMMEMNGYLFAQMRNPGSSSSRKRKVVKRCSTPHEKSFGKRMKTESLSQSIICPSSTDECNTTDSEKSHDEQDTNDVDKEEEEINDDVDEEVDAIVEDGSMDVTEEVVNTSPQSPPSLECYLCLVCSEEFATKDDLKNHMVESHDEESMTNGNYECGVCGQLFVQPHVLKKHEERHETATKYKGSYINYVQESEQPTCTSEHPKRFKNEFPLVADMKTFIRTFSADDFYSSKQRLYVCKFCPLTFKSVGGLTKNFQMHAERRDYKCRICVLRFPTMPSAKSHIESVHLKRKPYKCNVCSKFFNKKSTLMDHMPVHTKVLKFHCDICGNKFRRQAQLIRHLEKAHKTLSYTCSICSLHFGNEETFKEHIMEHAVDEEATSQQHTDEN